MQKTHDNASLCRIADNVGEALQGEESIREKTDSRGIVWSKVYFGSGAHYKNWLAQVLEVYGEENVEVEPVDFTGLKCFEESEDTAYRIWVKRQG
jgi:hypothetical protein